MIELIIKTIMTEYIKKILDKKYFWLTMSILLLLYISAKKYYNNDDFLKIIDKYNQVKIISYSDIHQDNPENYLPFIDSFFKKFPDVALANIWLWRDNVIDENGNVVLNSRVSNTYYHDNKGNLISWLDSQEMDTESNKEKYNKICDDNIYDGFINSDKNFDCLDYALMINQGVNRNKEHKVIKKEEHYYNRSLLLIHNYYISDGDIHNDHEIRKIKNGVYIPIKYKGQVGGYMGAIVIKSTKAFNGEKKAIEMESKKIYDEIAKFNLDIIRGKKKWSDR